MGEPQPAGGPGAAGTGILAGRFRLVSPATATLPGAAAVIMTALGVVLADLVHQLTFLNTWAGIPVFLGYAGAGVVIARRQPHNPVGWDHQPDSDVRAGHRAPDRRVRRPGLAATQLLSLSFPVAVAASTLAAADLDWVRADLARVVHQALEPAHTSVRTIDGARTPGRHPRPGGSP